MPEDWRQWVGSVVDNNIPLLEFVGGTTRSGVFKTNFSEKRAVIKLSVVDAESMESRLENLRAAERLSHPNLLQVYKSGRCELGGEELLYVISEFADENLAQVLPERALSGAETREVLRSTLDALSYLHGQGFVHGGLKPANIMASGELLKLASDDVRRVGDKADNGTPQPYDAPEISQGVTPATDIWALGVTLVEVMSQRVPAGFRKELDALPSPFREIAPRCLANDPGQRATIEEIRESLNPRKAAVPVKAAAAPKVTQRQSVNKAYVVLAAVALIIAAAVAIPKLAKHSPEEPENAAETSVVPQAAPDKNESGTKDKGRPREKATSSASSNAGQEGYEPVDTVRRYPGGETTRAAKAEEIKPPAAPKTADESSGVLQRVMPAVSRGALSTIQGTVRVKLKLQVNAAGDVTETEFVNRGPSSYFANRAQQAAQQWKFAPSENARAWSLQFNFRRDGTTAIPSEISR